MRIRITFQIAHFRCGYTKFRDRFEKMYGKLPSRRAKVKLKSVWHYLVNDNQAEARKQFKKLEKEFNI